MKARALLAGVAALGVAAAIGWSVNRPQTPATGAPAPAAAVSPLPQATQRSLDAAASMPPRPQVALHGVIFRGNKGNDSQALLSVGNQPEQPYGVGETVAAGWRVQAIRPEAVVLASEADQVTIGMAAPVAALAAPPAQPSSGAASTRRLPGFIAGPVQPGDAAQAHERNKRFLDTVQGKLGAR